MVTCRGLHTKGPTFLLCICTCKHMQAFVYVCQNTCDIHMVARRDCQLSFLRPYSPSFETETLNSLSLATSAGLSCHWAPGIHLSLLSQTLGHKHGAVNTWLLNVCSGTWTQVSVFMGSQSLYDGDDFPASEILSTILKLLVAASALVRVLLLWTDTMTKAYFSFTIIIYWNNV